MSGRKKNNNSNFVLGYALRVLCILLSCQCCVSMSSLTDRKLQNTDINSIADILQNLSITFLRQVNNHETLIKHFMSKTDSDVNTLKEKLTAIQTELILIKEENKQLKEEVLKYKTQISEHKNTLERQKTLITEMKEHTVAIKQDFRNETQDIIARLKEQDDQIVFQRKRNIKQEKTIQKLEIMFGDLNTQYRNETEELINRLKKQDDRQTEQSKNYQKLENMISDLKKSQLNETHQLIIQFKEQDNRQTEQEHVSKKLENMISELKESLQNETQKSIIRWIQQGSVIKKKYIDCADILKNNPWIKGHNGVHTIYNKNSSVQVFCDMTTEGGGWTVIQRNNMTLNFHRNWKEYKNGFGNASGEYWIGNEEIHYLTTESSQELRVDLTSKSGTKRFAKYSTFKVDSESNKYKLTVGGNSGSAGNGFDRKTYSPGVQNGMVFTTKDNDNDNYSDNCATRWKGGWWHNNCYYSFLNTKVQNYHDWRSTLWNVKLQTSQMMIRPKQ